MVCLLLLDALRNAYGKASTAHEALGSKHTYLCITGSGRVNAGTITGVRIGVFRDTHGNRSPTAHKHKLAQCSS